MAILIACLSVGKGTWGHVNRLIEDGEWDKVFLITNEFGKENFNFNEKTEAIVINFKNSLEGIRDEIVDKLKEKIKDSEVALNFISGEGKEHMALVSAILRLGISIKFVALTQDGMKEV